MICGFSNSMLNRRLEILFFNELAFADRTVSLELVLLLAVLQLLFMFDCHTSFVTSGLDFGCFLEFDLGSSVSYCSLGHSSLDGKTKGVDSSSADGGLCCCCLQ